MNLLPSAYKFAKKVQGCWKDKKFEKITGTLRNTTLKKKWVILVSKQKVSCYK